LQLLQNIFFMANYALFPDYLLKYEIKAFYAPVGMLCPARAIAGNPDG
jgi:hypothetical protein